MSIGPALEIEHLIGVPGSPLRRVKNSADREQILGLLNRGGSGPELALRGYLAIGKVPADKLVNLETITGALGLADCVTYLPSLSRKVQTVDAAIALEAAAGLLRASPKLNAWQIASLLSRSVRRFTKYTPTTRSVASLVGVTTSLVHATKSSSRPRTQKKQSPFVNLINLCLSFAAGGDSADVRFETAKLVVLAVDYLGAEIEHSIEHDGPGGQAFMTVLADVLTDMRAFATVPDISNFERRARLLLRHRITEQRTRTELLALWESRSHYEEQLQRILCELLERTPTTSSLELPDTSPQSIKVLRLASVLLDAWEAKSAGAKAESSFQRLQATLQQFFSLTLKEEVGVVIGFNPRLHEVWGDGSAVDTEQQVRIIRPRVEFIGADSVATILIKSLVEPIGDSS